MKTPYLIIKNRLVPNELKNTPILFFMQAGSAEQIFVESLKAAI